MGGFGDLWKTGSLGNLLQQQQNQNNAWITVSGTAANANTAGTLDLSQFLPTGLVREKNIEREDPNDERVWLRNRIKEMMWRAN